MKTHRIKLASQYFDAVQKEEKNFEIRKNDRDYREGDWLILREWDGSNFTGRKIVRRIVHIYELDLIGFDNWIAMTIE